MENFKNEFQVWSPKLYLIAVVVGVSIVVSLCVNSFLGVNTEAEVWRKTSIQAIYEVNQGIANLNKAQQAQQQITTALNNLKAELVELNDLKVDEVLGKYFKGK